MAEMRLTALVSLVVGVCAAISGGAVTYDGVVGSAEWAGTPATQDNYTGFGNQITNGYSGSELDGLYVRTDGTYLYVAVTGNLEENGNAQVILLEVRPGGQNVLKTEIAPLTTELTCPGNGPPSAVQGMGQALTNDGGTPPQTIRDPASTGTTLDAGFAPNYALAVDTYGHTVYVTQYNLFDTSQGTWDDPNTNDGTTCGVPNEALDYYATRTYRGNVGVDSGSGVLYVPPEASNPNGSEFAYNNTGYAGVTGTTVGDPSTQTTGLEAKIALADLGLTPMTSGALTVKIAVFLTDGSGSFSNQTLPGIAGAVPVASMGPRPNFVGITTGGIGGDGNQFATVTRTVDTGFVPTINGADLVSKYGAANLVASQDTPTSFGNHPQNPDLNSAGSELDEMYLQSDGDLEIAITGNLQPNGNDLVIFLDTGEVVPMPEPDPPLTGEGLTKVLDGNAGRIAGLAGDNIPLDADYAVVVNNWQGTIYVDLVDLNRNTTTYMGSNGVGSGNGNLGGGAADATWQIALTNTNVAGVDADWANDPFIQAGNAATATTGFEIKIPLAAVGSPAPGTNVCVFAMVKGGNSGYLSNQFLPADVGGGWPNFANPPVNLNSYGYSCMGVTVQAGCAAPVVNAITPSVAVQDYGNLPPHPPYGNAAPPGPVNAMITGSNFPVPPAAAPSVKLVQAGKSDIVGTGVSVIDAGTLTATFDLGGAAPGALDGTWDVVVTSCATGTLSGRFTVSMCFSPRQDADGDGDVDLDDFGIFQACFNGPNRPYNPAADQRKCACMNSDAGTSSDPVVPDVDLMDFGRFQGCFNGPNRPAIAGC